MKVVEMKMSYETLSSPAFHPKARDKCRKWQVFWLASC